MGRLHLGDGGREQLRNPRGAGLRAGFVAHAPFGRERLEPREVPGTVALGMHGAARQGQDQEGNERASHAAYYNSPGRISESGNRYTARP